MKKSTLYSIQLAARRDEDEDGEDLTRTFHQVTPAHDWEREMVAQGYRVGWILPEALCLAIPSHLWSIMTYSDSPAGLNIASRFYESESEALRWQKIIYAQAAHLRETGVAPGAFYVCLKYPANYIEELAQRFEDHLAERQLEAEQERGSDSSLGVGAFSNSVLSEITGYVDDDGMPTGKSTWPEGMGLVFTPAEWRSHLRLKRGQALE